MQHASRSNPPWIISSLRPRLCPLRSARHEMIGQRYCPFCKASALNACNHLALAAEARDFVRRCVELSQAQAQWQNLCALRQRHLRQSGDWTPEREDFTWLETAFRSEFLERLRWFRGMEYEWRTGPKPEHGGFYVLLWSREPKRLWWELREEFERQSTILALPPPSTTRGKGTEHIARHATLSGITEPWLINPSALSPASRS